MGKLVDEGERHVLRVYLEAIARGDLYIGLYSDVNEPAENATLATITELAVANGYARQQLVDGDWSVPADVATNVQMIFTSVGAGWGSVYGYFICNVNAGVGGSLIFVEHFSDGPYNNLTGLSIYVTPAIQAA